VYTVNPITSTNEEIIDRCGNKTVYEYDDAGRTTKVTNKKADGTDIANVSYGYDDFDNLRKITRGDGMEYELKYNAFHNLESIGITGKTDGDLIKYTYKNGNGRLKQMTYANGDTMKATYNSIGQMISEKWYNSSNLMTAGYKYTYDGNGNVVRSVDILQEKEYNYLYENGMLIRALEYDATISDETVTAKVLVNTVLYTYGAKGNLATKTLLPASGESFKYYYECNDENTVLEFSAGGNIITSSSNNDSFGRKEFDELQLATGVISRKFTYYNGEVTDEHKDNAKVKSAPTTQLVKQIEYSDGRTISYEYDAEERITKITDSIDGVTEYTYDAQGQLLTETVNDNLVNTMTYDGYGNIASKNSKFYTYDYIWKDQLVCYDAQCCMTYDAQGNPLTYLGHTLTWEKGRQLKSFDSNTYTYNANGIRTSKTVNGVKHEYTLDGTKILRETWDDNTLIPLYDNEESVCGIIYNNVPYYFIKNLQGDVIAIVDKDAQTVARYSYDAWGAVTSAVTYTKLTDGVDIATINPFRYKEYYYDSETALYYLQSRYYNATVGRFLNSDDIENLEYLNGPLDLNLFTYTVNCPIILTDGCGEGWLKDKIKKVVNKVKKAVTTVVGATKKVVSTVKNGIKTVCTSVGEFFKNTVWKKWLVNGVWNTFCKKWVWEKFCKEMVYNTFIKKWVWETFCKKCTWETFCKKWVWQTFCKKWVWETFCKDWMADKAWNWLKSNWKSVVDWFMAIGGGASAVVSILMSVGLFSIPVAGQIALGVFGIVTFVWTVIRLLGF
jgi:RHS repeat-associated protein